MDEKATLHRYLRVRRADLLRKLDGLSEYDARRPLTATGTNLLGLVKHVASVELGYFGEVFGRPSGLPLPSLADDAEPDADMWAAPEETREQILELHRLSAAHSDATIEQLPIDAEGEVLWWPEERRHVTLHQILVHMCVETARHRGHASVASGVSKATWVAWSSHSPSRPPSTPILSWNRTSTSCAPQAL